MQVEALPLVLSLARADERAASARVLAQHLGAHHLVVFVKDEETGTYLPAPGFLQTLPRGRAWRDLVSACAPDGHQRGSLRWPGTDQDLPALAVCSPEGVVMVLLGGEPGVAQSLELLPLLGVVGATFRAERRALALAGQAAVAREAGRQAAALATALAHAQTELSETLRRLREAEKRKDEFLAMLAHELRNPLAAAANAVQVIRAGAQDPMRHTRALDIVERQTRTLARLVDDLLDMSRITLGKLDLRREPLDLSSVVRRAADSARAALEAAGQTLELIVPKAPVWVDGDDLRLEQVVTNLLTNAARYAGRGARVDVTLDEREGSASLTVRDTGAGIGPDLLPRIFDQFSQGSQGLARTAGGLGIGLALVREIVELHNGRVSAASRGPGTGAAFVIEIPVTSRRASAAGMGPVRVAERPNRRVLVVDDNPDSADMLGTVLELWGHEVCLAHDGEMALQEAARFQPDVVLLDIGLPGMSGYGVAEHLAGAGGPRPLLVALTGYGQPQDVERAHDSGFDVHLLKPVDFGRLQEVLATPSERPA